MTCLNYDYAPSERYCFQIGLHWLGNEFPPLKALDAEAKRFGLSQEQVNVFMRHHLLQIKFLFTPSTYPFLTRLKLAFHFLFG